jgi:hypothetical protein
MEDNEFVFTDGCFFKTASIKSPEAVIQEFYEIYDLEHVKIMIWRMFKTAMSSENPVFMNPDEEIGDVIFFIELFLMLNIAVHEINQRAVQRR